VDLSSLAAEVVSELRDHKSAWKVGFTAHRGLKTMGDKGMLRTLLTNLIGDCWKAGFEHNDHKITFGSMPVDGVNAFFARCTGNHTGDGLDLTHIQRIVAQHGGSAWSKNGADRRPTFYFTLQP
jgi:hypothetical protein